LEPLENTLFFIEGIKDLSQYTSAPLPAKSLLPEWYKSIIPNKQVPNLKSCLPFFDAMSSGYTQVTWADIEVKRIDDSIELVVKHNLSLVEKRETKSVVSYTGEYEDTEFIWQRYWIPKLPVGYSALITHPLNRIDLPFTTVSAIVDVDEFFHFPVANIPFYIKSEFEGVIPKGTPMYQIIPIKRDNWDTDIIAFDPHTQKENDTIIKEIGKSPYRKFFWKKKYYSK